jgi:hypothetical protein
MTALTRTVTEKTKQENTWFGTPTMYAAGAHHGSISTPAKSMIYLTIGVTIQEAGLIVVRNSKRSKFKAALPLMKKPATGSAPKSQVRITHTGAAVHVHTGLWKVRNFVSGLAILGVETFPIYRRCLSLIPIRECRQACKGSPVLHQS